jgi:hypothetical protein
MANIGKWLGNTAHDALMSGAGKSAAEHMITGAALGAASGVGGSFLNDDGTPISSGISGAVEGAVLGGAARFSSAKYAAGRFSSWAAGDIAKGLPVGKGVFGSDMKFSYFTASKEPTSFWNPVKYN